MDFTYQPVERYRAIMALLFLYYQILNLLSKKFLFLNSVNLNYNPPVAKITASAASVDLRVIKIRLHILGERDQDQTALFVREAINFNVLQHNPDF